MAKRTQTKAPSARVKKAKPAKAPKRTSAKAARTKAVAPPPKEAKAAPAKRTTVTDPTRNAKSRPASKPASQQANATAARRPTPPPADAHARGNVGAIDDNRPLPRTYLKAKELKEFRELLLQKRRELLGDVTNMADTALRRNQEGAGETSNMPLHMADLGSDNWEQEFTLGLIANERAVVREIDEALDRIEKKTYGMCLATHQPISIERLRAKPWAKYCIDYARAQEEGRVR